MSFKIIGTPLLGSLQSIPRPSILYLFLYESSESGNKKARYALTHIGLIKSVIRAGDALIMIF